MSQSENAASVVPELNKTADGSSDEASEDTEGLQEIEARKLIRRLRIQVSQYQPSITWQEYLHSDDTF